MDYTCTLCNFSTRSDWQWEMHQNDIFHTAAALREQTAELRDALTKCEIPLRYVNFDGDYDNRFAVPAAQAAARAILAKYKE